jgi:hypothetical protein
MEGKNVIFEEKVRGHMVTFSLDKYDHFILEKILDVGRL